MAAELFIQPSRALDNNADPYAGAKAFFYQTGTTTLQSVFTTAALSVAHANPVIADSSGKFPNIYMNSTLDYRVVIKNSTESVTLHDIDPVNNTAIADLLGRFITPVDQGKTSQTVSKMAGITGTDHSFLFVSGYHTAGDLGGGLFAWEGSTSKVLHNGGTIIDPGRTFPTDWTNQTQLDTWFAAGVSGTGVWRRVVDYSVGHAVWYGVKYDYVIGTGAGTDDCRPINKTLAIHQVAQLPNGFMLVRDKSLNMTLRSGGGGELRGVGGTKIYGGYGGSVLCGETGNSAVIDVIGSQGTRVKDVAIVSGLNTPSKCGYHIARATTSQYAQFNVIEDCYIDIATAPTAYTNKGSVAVNNVAAELFTIKGSCYIKGDTAVNISSANYFGITSQYATLETTITSTSAIWFTGHVTLHSYNPVGTPLRIDGAAAVFGEVYTACETSGGAIVAGTDGCRLNGLSASRLHIYAESCDYMGDISYLDGCDLSFHGLWLVNTPVRSTIAFCTFQRSNIRLRPTGAGAIAHAHWVIETGNNSWSDCTIEAPRAPSTAFLQSSPVNHADMTYIASDRRRVLTGSVTTDVASIANNAQASFDVTVTGVTVAGNWHCTVSPSADPGALGISAIVRANDTVRVTLINNSGGAIDPASITYNVRATRI